MTTTLPYILRTSSTAESRQSPLANEKNEMAKISQFWHNQKVEEPKDEEAGSRREKSYEQIRRADSLSQFSINSASDISDLK